MNCPRNIATSPDNSQVTSLVSSSLPVHLMPSLSPRTGFAYYQSNLAPPRSMPSPEQQKEMLANVIDSVLQLIDEDDDFLDFSMDNPQKDPLAPSQ
jgi:hypothetical protein